MAISKFLQNNRLFQECIEALNAQPLSIEESERMLKLLITIFPFTNWGKVDWEKINKKINIGYDPHKIISTLQTLLPAPVDKPCYIEWSGGGYPAIKTNLDNIINHFDDVTCVSFEKFIFNPEQGYIIEILPSDEMTVGIIELERKL